VFSQARVAYPEGRFVLVVAGIGTSEASRFAYERGVSIWGQNSMASLLNAELIEAARAGILENAGGARTDAKRLEERLVAILPGHEAWAEYQRFVADLFEHLFVPPLTDPRYEYADATGRDRRDLILDNVAPDGLWAQLRQRYDADYIVVDAKNHEAPIGKVEVLKLAHYLKPRGCGRFGLLVTRKGASEAGKHAVREQWVSENKMIVVLDDSSVGSMLELAKDGGQPEDVIRREISNFRVSL
jgi:hypothetical protein